MPATIILPYKCDASLRSRWHGGRRVPWTNYGPYISQTFLLTNLPLPGKIPAYFARRDPVIRPPKYAFERGSDVRFLRSDTRFRPPSILHRVRCTPSPRCAERTQCENRKDRRSRYLQLFGPEKRTQNKAIHSSTPRGPNYPRTAPSLPILPSFTGLAATWLLAATRT